MSEEERSRQARIAAQVAGEVDLSARSQHLLAVRIAGELQAAWDRGCESARKEARG